MGRKEAYREQAIRHGTVVLELARDEGLACGIFVVVLVRIVGVDDFAAEVELLDVAVGGG